MLAPAEKIWDHLFDLLGLRRRIDVIDVGSNPLDGGDPPYKSMQADGLCSVVGFEPHPEALEALGKLEIPNSRYLPNVIGNGQPGVLHVCAASGLTSLLEPDPERLALLNMHPEFGKVVERLPVETTRLDDIDAGMDFLKIDVQGGEYQVFRGAQKKLAEAVVIHTEVSFLRVYRDQPSFALIDMYLGNLGFVLHTFTDIKRWPVSPAVVDGNPRAPLRQVVDGDAVYVRDWNAKMEPDQWKALAVIMHHAYQSYDIALRCVMALAEMGELPEDAPDRYAALLGGKE